MQNFKNYAEFKTPDQIAQEEVAAQEPTSPVPISPARIPEDSQPSALAQESKQPIVQDPPAASMLDLNEHAEDHLQEDWQDLYLLVFHFEQFILISLFSLCFMF